MGEEIKEKIKAYYVANDIDEVLDYFTNLQEKLKVSQTNEETYRLEMQDITKILRLDEHTIFDEVKEYATNLQEELKSANESITWWKNRFNAVEKENERLKEENKRIFSKVNDDELLISNAMNYTEAQDYKSRCEKAIRYIINNKLYDFDYDKEELFEIVSDKISKEYLLSILNGGENND